MFQNAGSSWTTRSGGLGHTPEPHAFGERHHHKSLKTVIGIAILIALSIVFARFDSGRKASGALTAPITSHHAISNQ